jgi:primosomal protein N''
MKDKKMGLKALFSYQLYAKNNKLFTRALSGQGQNMSAGRKIQNSGSSAGQAPWR